MKLVNWLVRRSIINRAWLTLALLYLWLCCINFFWGISGIHGFKNYISHFLGLDAMELDGWLKFWLYGTVLELHPIKFTTISLLFAICFFFWCTKKYHELLVIMILLITGLNIFCIIDPFAHFAN